MHQFGVTQRKVIARELVELLTENLTAHFGHRPTGTKPNGMRFERRVDDVLCQGIPALGFSHAGKETATVNKPNRLQIQEFATNFRATPLLQ